MAARSRLRVWSEGARLRRWAVALFVALIVVAGGSGRASAMCREHPLSDLGTRVPRMARPAPLMLFAGAIAAPAVFAPTGIDQHVRVVAQKNLGGRYDAESISVVAPYSLAASLAVGYAVGLVVTDCPAVALTARALQAMGLAFLVMGASKYVVGRTYPAGDPYAANRLADDGRSRHFEPFGSAGSWPSGHSATTFAFAAVLRTALPSRLGVVRYGGYVLAAAVSAAMLYGDHHWASDVLSGALLGEAIGRSVGPPPVRDSSAIAVVPAASGLAIVGAF